jgi:cyanophycin synthetase
MDYGHNPPAVRALVELVEKLEVRGRRLLVLAAPGDRRDEDIRAIAMAVAGRFDHYICRRDDNVRGRGPQEVPHMLARTLREAGVPEGQITVIEREVPAVQAVLEMAQPEDLLLVFADAIERTWKQITSFRSEREVALEPRRRPDLVPIPPAEPQLRFNSEQLIRDERGVILAPRDADEPAD